MFLPYFSNYKLNGKEDTVEPVVDSQETTNDMSQPSVTTTKDSTENPAEGTLYYVC